MLCTSRLVNILSLSFSSLGHLAEFQVDRFVQTKLSFFLPYKRSYTHPLLICIVYCEKPLAANSGQAIDVRVHQLCK